jgi:hypothetical protein
LVVVVVVVVVVVAVIIVVAVVKVAFVVVTMKMTTRFIGRQKHSFPVIYPCPPAHGKAFTILAVVVENLEHGVIT